VKRLVTSSGFAVILLGVMTTAVAGDAVWQYEGDRLSLTTAGSPTFEAAVDETGTTSERDELAPAEKSESVEDPVRFDSLWLVIVGVLGLLLVVGIVRTEWDWRRSDRPPDSGNGNDSGDVLTDE
jgi:hypothetical protein